MRATERFPRRAGKEFVRNLVGALVVYTPRCPLDPLAGRSAWRNIDLRRHLLARCGCAHHGGGDLGWQER